MVAACQQPLWNSVFILSEEEKQELKEAAASQALRRDMEKVSQGRFNPFACGKDVDVDKLLIFLTEYNDFVNHARRPFRRINDSHMLLIE